MEISNISKYLMRTIAIITGGDNAEREISLRSASAVKRTLEDEGYIILLYDFPVDQKKFLENKDDIYFCRVMIHGRGGEDGEVVQLLDECTIPHQSAPADIHAICIDKSVTKQIWKEA